MKTVLHILTQPEVPLAATVIAAQRDNPDCRVRILDLSQSEPDYQELLVEIFNADSVAVW